MDFEIIRSSRKTICLQLISADKAVVRAPLHMPARDIQAFIRAKEKWLESHRRQMLASRERMGDSAPFTRQEIAALGQKAVEVLREKLRHFAPMVGVDYGRVTVRCQKTKWGSCTAGGNLNFNCLLMLCPPEVVDYIVVHELCHRKEMNHSARFWDEVERVMPDYQKWQDWLKENGRRLIERIPA